MPKLFKERVKRHAQTVVHASKHLHKKLQTPVHHYISWWLVSVSVIAGFLIINSSAAQLAYGQTSPNPPPCNSASGTPCSNTINGNEPRSGNFNQPPCDSPSSTPCPPPQRQGSHNQNSSLGYPGDGNFNPPCNSASNSPCGRSGQGQPGQLNGQTAPGNDLKNNPGKFNQGSKNGHAVSDQQQQQMDQQRLDMMKRGLSSMAKQLSRIKSQVTQAQKQGVVIPDELTQALSTIENAVSQIKSAQSPDGVQNVMSEMQGATQTVQNWMPKLSQRAQFPIMLKQAQGYLTQANKQYAYDAKRAQTAKVDLTQALVNFKSAIKNQQDTLDQIKSTWQSDPQTAMDSLQNDFFANMDSLQSAQQVLYISLNARQGLAEMSKEISQAEKQLKVL